jgi:outer membrane protein assembly factor BamA
VWAAASRALRIAVVSSLVSIAFSPDAFAQAPERIVQIRVHGNHTTPDADILSLSGLMVGEDASDVRLQAAERTLRATGRFERVELLRRSLSISDASQLLVVIVVDEHPAVRPGDLTPGPMKKIASAGMWLPILQRQDGYALTYGARYSFNDALGDRSRVSVPLSWGGERRVAMEAERLFDRTHTVVRGAVSLYQRQNPHFDVPDTRREARVGADRTITSWLTVGAGTRIANVAFGDTYEARHTAGGLHATVDTRIDPSFPRNAVHARIGWERLGFQSGRASLWHADIRGFIGVGGSRVLALRGQFATSTSALPFAEQRLLGGNTSLRGYPAGYRSGDNLAAGTIELRQPINSPLSVGRFGVKAFADVGNTWSAGERIGDQPFERGIGGGVYLGAGPFIMDVDVAWPEQGTPRTHVGLGVSF